MFGFVPAVHHGGAPFVPTQLSGLQLWMKADGTLWQDSGRTTPAVADADPIGSADDAGPLGNHALQPTGANRPLLKLAILNGKPVARLNGSSSSLRSASVAANRNTLAVFMVVKLGSAALAMLTDFNTGTSLQLRPNNASQRIEYEYVSDGTVIYKTCLATSTSGFVVLSFISHATRCQFRVNGLYSNLALQTAQAISDLFIGRYHGGGFFLSADMPELIVYNASLSGGQVASAEAYLAAKYGLALSTFPSKQVVCQGNSITLGWNLPDVTTAYPAVMQSNLGAGSWKVWNYGIGSQTTTGLVTDAGRWVDVKYDPVAFSKNILVGWEVTNELFFGTAQATAYANYVSYCQARQAAGWKVVAVTVTPRSDAGTPGSFEADRQTTNTSIRANWNTFADALADVAGDATMGPAGAELSATYYLDKVHPTAVGYALIEPYIRTAVLSL